MLAVLIGLSYLVFALIGAISAAAFVFTVESS